MPCWMLPLSANKDLTLLPYFFDIKYLVRYILPSDGMPHSTAAQALDPSSSDSRAGDVHCSECPILMQDSPSSASAQPLKSMGVFNFKIAILVNYDITSFDEHFYQESIHGLLYSVDPWHRV